MLQFLVDTLLRASDLALIALGLSMVYGLVKFPNIAHVQYAMFGAYVTYAMHASGVPLVLAIAISCAVTGALTLGLHLLVFRRLLRAGPAIAMIGSLAVAMLVVAFMQGFAGSFPRMFNLPLTEPILIGEARVTATQLYFVGTTVVLLLLFAMLLFFTRTGRAMRALASNPALAAASGLNAEGITRGVAFASGAIAGLGGSMLALSTGAHINLGYDLLLPVFAAAILGGLGNPLGAVAGALLIAATETAVTNIDFGGLVGGDPLFMPVAYISAASFLILLLALLFKPYGLFDREVRRV
ncbi:MULTISPECIES: branched-chain amino acid ABC transporter permease [Comamonas]|jgi:branched-chain amino acid transport system permease protein|uniref:Branched-chain amino acid ABC transporter permease n=1 Tax=Comamonas terrigena TaxID=32013 RepID=A0A2A7URT8_COMTR|nr:MULTISPECIES: branched-chain amino acid ABC transporter permease [Comamonas]MBD9533903.1 branched-chain amino acid ABC transporter permease [Comamonas sp. CMM01]MBV7419464.1 branched-chain amino acid ABC transporter permease [Comamonas sp. CMM03]MDH0049055.1 branched-chain amino acid ABC transporter permease [Comamonas terrigena]MDH0513424.1 branched-chain amino acid ABC transporter permease [Comamonas terrigena]MDH1092919.1 branched-chain amino acid ABC transporter permease [Comamonas terr